MMGMEAISTSAARKNLFNLVRQVNDDGEAVAITYQGGTAVLVGQDEWTALQRVAREAATTNF